MMPTFAKSARGRLPPLSTVAHRILLMAGQEEPDLPGMTRLIELDPALTVSVLRLVNSPFYGLSRQVGTVSDAIMVVGMGTVRRIAITSAVAQPLGQLPLDSRLVEAMWRKALAGAVLACKLLDGHAQSQVAFTAGVLQDIGRLELYLRCPESYAPIVGLAGADLWRAEREGFEQTHAEAGAELADAWALPNAIVKAVASHHEQGQQAPQEPVAQAVWLASLIEDGDTSLATLPALQHIQADISAARAASQVEVAALCSAVGV